MEIKAKFGIIFWDSEKKIVFFTKDEMVYKAKILHVDLQKQTLKLYLFNTNQIIDIGLTNQIASPDRSCGKRESWEEACSKNLIISPLSGRVTKIHVIPNQFVEKNMPLITIESMKMENEIRAPFDLFIKSISISETDLVKQNQLLIQVKKGTRGNF